MFAPGLSTLELGYVSGERAADRIEALGTNRFPRIMEQCDFGHQSEYHCRRLLISAIELPTIDIPIWQ